MDIATQSTGGIYSAAFNHHSKLTRFSIGQAPGLAGRTGHLAESYGKPQLRQLSWGTTDMLSGRVFSSGRIRMSFFARLKAASETEWRSYIEHPFTNAMADGSLPEPAFRHYLVQDYLFLIEFARAYALSVYKSPTLADMREAAAGLSAILDIEMDLHVKLCAGWGLSPDDLEQTPPAVETLAYTRYVLDAGMRGDLLALKVAFAPGVVGYAEIATRLASRADALAATNPYRDWIAEYAGAPYQDVAAKARAHLEGLADRYATRAREAELIVIFKEATRLEADFWEMGWRLNEKPTIR